MKNAFITTALIATAAFSACQVQPLELQEPQEPDTDSKAVSMSFTAKVEEEDATRTFIPEGNLVKWNDQDCISIFDVNVKPAKDAKFSLVTTITPGDETHPSVTNYEFVGEVPESSIGYYALYPYSDCSGDDIDTESEKLGLYLDTKNDLEYITVVWSGYHQNAKLGGFDPDKAMLMAYTPADEKTLTFKQVFSFLKFTVTFPLKNIVFRGYSDAAHTTEVPLAAQNVTLSMDDDGNPKITEFSTAKYGNDGEIIFKKNTETILNENDDTIYPGTYLVAVMPQTLAGGFEIEFNGIPVDVALHDNTRSTTKSVTLERGKILNLGSFSTWDFYAQGDWSGEGTENNPYLIATVDQLKLLAERVNSEKTTGTYATKYYKLLNDIDCENKVLSSIGANNLTRFSGVFDGDGHTISNCVIGRIGYTTGLFGYLRNATIKNLSIKPAGILNMEDNTTSKSYSVIAGTAISDDDKYTVIDNCHVLASDNTISLTYSYGNIDYGSIVGSSYGNLKLTNCSNALSVTLAPESYSETKAAIAVPDLRPYHGRFGGILGYQNPSSDDVYCIIDKCRNSGNIDFITQHSHGSAGGILGSDEDDWPDNTTLRITNCMNSGSVRINDGVSTVGDNAYAGGIVGLHDSDGDSDNGDPYIYNCLNTGYIYSAGYTSYSGGIIGNCYDGDTDVFNCANTGGISGGTGFKRDRRLGAICGNKEGSYYYCYWHSTLPLYDNTWGDGTNCSGNGISASTMNSNRSIQPNGIPHLDASKFVEWQGDENSLTLVY